jgi:hypothetical protein
VQVFIFSHDTQQVLSGHPLATFHAQPNLKKPTNIVTAKCNAQQLLTNPNYSPSTKSAALF